MNPWLWLLLIALAVEAGLILTGRPTLSQEARNAARRHRWVPWAVIAGTALLFGHFWLGWFW